MNTKFLLNKNIIFYAISNILQSSLMFYMIIVLFYKEIGLSFTLIMILSSIENVIAFVFEVPSGFFADYFGRKKSIVLGKFCSVLALLCYLLFPTFVGCTIAVVLLSFSNVFLSGANSAYLYDYLKKYDIQQNYASIIGKIKAISLLLSSILTLFSSYLFSLNLFLPFYISFVFVVVAFVVALFLEQDSNLSEIKQFQIRNMFKIDTSLWNDICHTKKLIFLYTMGVVIISNGYYLLQPYLETKISLGFIGVILFSFKIVESISNFFIKKLFFIFKNKLPIFLFLTLGITFISMQYVSIDIIILLLLVCRMFSSIFWTYIFENIHIYVDSKYRASIISIVSFVSSIFLIFSDILIGVITDVFSLQITYLILGIISLVIIPFVFSLKYSK